MRTTSTSAGHLRKRLVTIVLAGDLTKKLNALPPEALQPETPPPVG
ncbi:MAG: hypothetical protein LC797_00840 [Chloroflexi bacterium]|nr:hypothetical protein [Chloroflexota bacterium]